MFMALMERKYFDFFWHIYKKSNIKSKSMIELSQLYITPMWEGFMWVCGVCIGQYTCIVSILSIAYPKHSIKKEFSVKELPCSIIFKMVVTKRHVAIDQLCLCVPGTLYLYCADAMYTLVKDAFFRNKSQFYTNSKKPLSFKLHTLCHDTTGGLHVSICAYECLYLGFKLTDGRIVRDLPQSQNFSQKLWCQLWYGFYDLNTQCLTNTNHISMDE